MWEGGCWFGWFGVAGGLFVCGVGLGGLRQGRGAGAAGWLNILANNVCVLRLLGFVSVRVCHGCGWYGVRRVGCWRAWAAKRFMPSLSLFAMA